MTSPTRMRGALAAALVAALALAGCAGIPTTGPVGTVDIDTGSDDGRLLVLPPGPQAGDGPEQILAGFLGAQRAPQGNYSVARQFLSDTLRGEWSPTARVRVSDSPVAPVETPDGGLHVDMTVSAVVDATGAYQQLRDPERDGLDYSFVRNSDGEWRISSAPEGSVISTRGFENSFTATPLYFFDPSGTALVPDVRWFPDAPGRADRITRALLAGPSPWYQNGVLITAFPSGAAIDPGVTVANGTATIALTADVASQDDDARWRMLQQARLTLLSLSEVRDVQLTAGGFPLDVAEGDSAESSFVVASDPLGLADGGFGYLSSSAVEGLPRLSADIERLAPLGAVVARNRQSAAVRSAEGVWLVAAGAPPLLLDQRRGLVDPGLDAQGFVWSAVADAADSIVALDASGVPHPISAPNLDGEIVSLEVSRDGSRLIIATQDASGPALTLAGIVRGGDGVPTGFGEPLSLPVGTAQLLDAAWLDASTVVTLSRDSTGVRVDSYRIGGRHESLGHLDAGVQLVGGNFVDGVRVRAEDGTVWRRNSSGGWQKTAVVASFLATQQ